MIDSRFRQSYQALCVDPFLPYLARLHPEYVTFAGCLLGVSVLPLLAFEFPWPALLALLLSGFCDTLDGALARYQRRSSPHGAALDIASDRVVEFAVVLGLFFADPQTRALPSLIMLGSILLCVTTFLVVGIFTSNESHKSFHYSPGLIERAEAFLFFTCMILFPTAFTAIASLFPSSRSTQPATASSNSWQTIDSRKLSICV